ncbi:hypothetical protein OHA40_12590 [Nocardia sp. NBC_00508]|uniref:hypothetical protein n=1 Tax=Nocardia sp. NBC_00508 TaxID=2975992 RepID=UPI002E8164A2|nr:hypothetical protein [Nocardia sp. NBC_00508]WUD68878.1 hypothetical protein OHA40_12590 [Nocardia sp. NBC_00508]
MTDPHIDISLARAADFESWVAVLLSDWWPVLTGDLPPPATTLRAWRADATGRNIFVEFVTRQRAVPQLMPGAHAAFATLGIRPDEPEWARSRGTHLVGDTEDAIIGLRYSETAHTVFVRLQSRPCQVAPGAVRRLLAGAEANLPFPDTTAGPLDVRVARNSARHLLAAHSARHSTPADPLQLGPPERVCDIGWAFIFPWSTTSWYIDGAVPTFPPGTRGPIVVVKDTGHTWLLDSLSNYDAQLIAYAREHGYPAPIGPPR